MSTPIISASTSATARGLVTVHGGLGSPIATAKEAQRRGVGSAFTEFGVERADAIFKYVDGEKHWFLSTIATAKKAQRRGVGAALMEFGVERADASLR
ncbi:hypothetical protein F66182_1941 [Fusarium sp. NRRL 66182]|nr:hypothetical protein F66182_1941 [Fusarium sp. NRRL 66182]